MNFKKNKEAKPKSLIRSILLSIAKIMSIAVFVGGVFGYLGFLKSKKNLKIEDASNHVRVQVEHNGELFKAVENKVAIFTESYMRIYHSEYQSYEEDFQNCFFSDSDGATRLKPEFYTGTYMVNGDFAKGITGFIGNNQEINLDFMRRLMIALKVLAKLGPAWSQSLSAFAVTFPENAIITFCLQEPWGLKADADLKMNELGVIRATTQKENPTRQAAWTGLYFDGTVDEWTITYQFPVDFEGQHIMNPSPDIYLNSLLEALIDDRIDGSYNMVLDRKGYLIAHPAVPNEEQRYVGQLSLEKAKIPYCNHVFSLIKNEIGLDFTGIRVIMDKRTLNYLIVGKIDGPGWLFINVLPRRLVNERARETLMVIGFGGTIATAATLAIVNSVLSEQLSKPLNLLQNATDHIGRGNYSNVADQKVKLPLHLTNEIGVLANRFYDMSTRIRDNHKHLETVVEDRTAELASANKRLRVMSYIDGLTEVNNRRIFDKDFETVFWEAKTHNTPFSLIMLDLDYFKNYNDLYGHSKGDDVLKKVADIMQNSVRQAAKVYRYGGEEFIIILPEVSQEAAVVIGQRILNNVVKQKIQHADSRYGYITVSGGVQQFKKTFRTRQQMLKAVDDKMYLAKRDGRNRVKG